MSEVKVVEIKGGPEKVEKAKAFRARISPVQPTDIVDVWRLVERSMRDGGQTYPDTTEDNPELIRSHLFSYIQSPLFAGLIAKSGKRSVGVVLGHVMTRPWGRPSRYAFVYGFWVDPQFRSRGVGKQLWSQYTEKLKVAGIYHWESHAHEHLVKELTRDEGFPVKRLVSVIGGRF